MTGSDPRLLIVYARRLGRDAVGCALGRQAHGASPHLGIDAIVTASQVVLALQTIRSRNLSPFTTSAGADYGSSNPASGWP